MRANNHSVRKPSRHSTIRASAFLGATSAVLQLVDDRRADCDVVAPPRCRPFDWWACCDRPHVADLVGKFDQFRRMALVARWQSEPPCALAVVATCRR